MTDPLRIVLELTRAGSAGAWSRALLDDLRALGLPRRDPAAAARVGEALRELVTAAGWAAHEAAIEQAMRDRRRVHITVRSAAAELHALPWELMTLRASGQHVGALPDVLLRHEWPGTRTAPEQPTPRPEGGRILLAWSAAGGPVPATAHVAAIRAAAEAAGYTGGRERLPTSPFDPERDMLAAASLDGIAETLSAASRGAPVAVLHLLCHGYARGQTSGVALDGAEASAGPVLADAGRLCQVLAPHAGMLQLVVLAACDSAATGALADHLGSIAQTLHRAGIRAVVGSRFPLSVPGSIRLAEHLYRALLVARASLERALLDARAALTGSAGDLDWASLQLHAREADGDDTRPLVIRPPRVATNGGRMESMPMIQLLLAHADDNEPVLAEGLPMDAAASAGMPADMRAADMRRYLRHDSADPNALPEQGWGVIAPEGPAGDRLLSLIAPLIEARREAQEGRPVNIYRVPPAVSARDAASWKRHVYWDEAVPEEDLPRYLLLLGDLTDVSIELQQILASDTFVGRLAFDEERDYEAYVDKVLRWERRPSSEAEARTLFYTARDGTAATSIGHKALMRPCFERFCVRQRGGSFPAKEVLEIDGTSGPGALFEQVSRAEPAVLFSMTHGLGAPRRGWRSADEQRARQGAMTLEDGLSIEAGDLAGRPFLPGGAWFSLACFGAGTPESSVFCRWLRDLSTLGKFTGRLDATLASLPKPGERPFIAALPKAALAKEDGPLAVIGHVDLAWTYAFQDIAMGTRARPSRFDGVFHSLLEHARVGVAHRELTRFFTTANEELSILYDEDAMGAVMARALSEDEMWRIRRAHLWMLRQDLAGYILLGDPAARLPLADAGARDATSMEDAVLAVFSGDQAERDIAAQHGVSRSELRRWVEAYRAAGRDALGKLR